MKSDRQTMPAPSSASCRSVSPLDDQIAGSMGRLAVRAEDRPHVQRFGLREAEQRVLAQLVDLARLAVRVEVRGAREHPQPAVADAPAVQRRILEPADPDRDVGAPLEQVDDPLVAVQLQFDLRKAFAVAAHERHDHVQHERRRRVDA
jgi:hypothetical protein